jgi:hypothetical protein
MPKEKENQSDIQILQVYNPLRFIAQTLDYPSVQLWQRRTLNGDQFPLPMLVSAVVSRIIVSPAVTLRLGRIYPQ